MQCTRSLLKSFIKSIHRIRAHHLFLTDHIFIVYKMMEDTDDEDDDETTLNGRFLIVAREMPGNGTRL